MPGSVTDYTAYLAPPRAPRAGRTVNVATALNAIPNGARAYLPPFCGTPLQLLAALDEARDRWSSLELVGGLLLADIAPMQHPGAPFRFTTWHMSGPYAPAAAAGVLDVIPARYSQAAALFRPDGPYPVDVALVQVSPPGTDGRFSLGTSVGAVVDVVRTAPLVIAQVNRQMPYTFGAGELPREAFDFLVEIDGPLPEPARAKPGPVEEAIAALVAPLVPDGATLQFGIGAVPEAIVAHLRARRNLGIHSGMISDGVIDLVEAGALTNACKAFDPDAIVAADVIGTRRLFGWVNRNPLVRMAPGSYTHALSVVSGCWQLRAINSAVEVALDGTVNAESVGERLISGPAGQPDFAEAALWAHDAINIVAMPSTAGGGRVSRIVRRLGNGAVVAVPRHLADHVVTEFGVAALRGHTLRARAEALRAIAHPQFRDGLA